ncbi:hypothetical protein GGR54DRAFT_635682 [Hypoxylon sp. NC1633]|nr:hypothetical protein GGR54DRAFT_635682 [Hypoxylon sp. NC1633]
MLRSLSPFLAILNVTEIYATNCVAMTTLQDLGHYHWYYPNISSGLRRIQVFHGCMDSTAISHLLSHTPYLVSFRFSCANNVYVADRARASHGDETKYNERINRVYAEGEEWDAGAFVATIGEHVGGRLEELAVTLEPRDDQPIAPISSMKEFVKLKTLELETCLLGGPDEVDAVPPLTQIVPSTLEELILCNKDGSHNTNVMSRLLNGFETSRPVTPPNPKSCTARSDPKTPTEDELEHKRAHIESQGISFMFEDCHVPIWKKNFIADIDADPVFQTSLTHPVSAMIKCVGCARLGSLYT